MSFTFNRTTNAAISDDSRKKTALLKDGSWIRKDVPDDDPVERETNFGKAVLSRFKSNENLNSSSDNTSSSSPSTPTTPTRNSSSVQSLSKRFSGNVEEQEKSSTLPANFSKTTSHTKSSTLPGSQKTTTKTTTVKDGTKTTETTITTRTSGVKPSTPSDTFASRVLSDAALKGQSPALAPKPTLSVSTSKGSPSTTRTTREVTAVRTLSDTSDGDDTKVSTVKSPTSSVTTTTRTYSDGGETTTTTTKKTSSTLISNTNSSTEDQLFDTLLPQSIKSTYSTSDSYEDTSVTSPTKSYTKTVIKDRPEDFISDNFVSTSIKTVSTTPSSYEYSSVSSPNSYEYSSVSSPKSFDYNSINSPSGTYDYSSTSSPSSYSRTSFTESSLSRPDDYYSDSITSKSTNTVYTTPERKVSEKDLCTYCRKSMLAEVKMILGEADIHCHATCFKCGVCHNTLGHLKAGDSLWVYRRVVHCESCFERTREKWRN